MIRIHQGVPAQLPNAGRAKMMTIRLAAETLATVNEAARRDGLPQNQWCLTLIERALKERAVEPKPSLKSSCPSYDDTP